MLLKRLQLLGYKTFAERSEFLFDEGITAVVGPNGSGKSNIADAVRWVLGEQSFSLLRAKKSEDMIFSGSERRARMGMAEATITLDNSESWLPVEFSEVAITRRSYRSGENVYLLNGSKVRLRDITDLLGKSGLSRRTYTVIGQGLVDTALSLRPQERRKLIEEAAGLTLYQSRRANALDRLDETRRNVLRVHDLIAEISPRLRRLQRQAERTREHAQIGKELDKALRIWYSYQWKRGQGELRRVRTVSGYQLERLETRRARVRELSERIAEIRSRQSDLRRQLSQWHRESSALHAQSEAHQRDLAVAEERRRLLMQRRDEVLSELAPLETSRAAQVEQISEVKAHLTILSKTLARQQADLEAAQVDLDARRNETAELQTAQARVQGDLLSLRTQIADHESRLSQLAERRLELQEERDTYTAASHSLEERMRTLRGELSALEAQLQTVDAAARKVGEQRAEREQRIAATQRRGRELYEQRNELDQRLGRLQERYDLLTRMREEGTGLYEGVRNVLQAGSQTSERGGLAGIVGTVAELIHVPRELETAVEVALGGQLQDVVVESWTDAQAAIAYLKRTRGGRATLLPLDTLRPGRSVRAPQMTGVVGVASELIECGSRLRPVAEYLLGRTIVCQVSVVRRVLGEVKGGYQIVTPEGELVRSSGAMTGGTRKRQRQGGILAREREWRELPEQLRALRSQRQALEDEIQDVAAKEKTLTDGLAVLIAQQNKLGKGRRDREQERVQAQQQVDRATSERDWRRSLIAESERELDELDEREKDLRRKLGERQVEVDAAEAELADLAAQIDQMDDRDLSAQLAERRAEIALTHQRQAGKEAELRGYQQSLRQIDQQIAARGRQADELAGQLVHTERRIEELRGQESALSVDIQTYADRIEPAERELEELEGQQSQTEAEESQARTRLQDVESRYSHAELQVARQEDHMTNLRRQIEDDLGLVDLEMGEDLSGQPLLPIRPLVSSLPEVEVLPEGLEEQIRALKRRLHRLGSINPDAPDEYREAQQRHEFLSTQAQDLEEATAHLRQVIAELDEVMKREFKRTFNAVAREFRTYFAQLFDGGSARLQLTDPDDLMSTGIDIVARPPGKRQQGLAVLSGGERALTAAALIFGILKVSPTPFCVLDEVDAALDEANVGRFRTVLRSLSEQTQFVVITHNRYTIEFADIVYGISMGADGVSCVISHRMSKDGAK